MKIWQSILYLLAGAAVGAAVTFLVLRFPGGRGEGRRLDLSFREGAEYRVRRVVDGDTVLIEPGIYVRYAGVSAPETRKFVEVQRPFGRESTEANRELVEGRRVRLRLAERGLGPYGRILANVLVRDAKTGEWKDVGEELARRGLVKPAYRSEGVPNRDRVGRACEEARAAGRGLWSLMSRRRN